MFNKQNFLQEDGTAQGPHMSCSYSDIAMYGYDLKALDYTPGVNCWKRFRDDIFTVWNHSREELDTFFNYLNTIDTTKKIQFTMSIGDKEGLEFLDLKLSLDHLTKKIIVDVYSKPTNSFTYVTPSTCYPRKNIENVPVGVALRLRRICDSNEKFEKRSQEYQNYLIARDYKPYKVQKQFSRVKAITREEARRPRTTNEYKAFPLITEYNPLLVDLNSVIKRNLPLLYYDNNMKNIFPEGNVKAQYRRGKNLKEILSPSGFPGNKIQRFSSLTKCNGKCDICKNFMCFSNTFKCTVTGKIYNINSTSVATVITLYILLHVPIVICNM